MPGRPSSHNRLTARRRGAKSEGDASHQEREVMAQSLTLRQANLLQRLLEELVQYREGMAQVLLERVPRLSQSGANRMIKSVQQVLRTLHEEEGREDDG